MKKMILTTVLIALIGAVSFGQRVVAKGNTFSALGDYKILTTDNPVSVNGEDCKAYRISYENSPLELTLVVCKEKKCKKFVVLSDKLSVQYICNQDYFGVERLDKSFEKEGFKTDDASLNKVEYFHQKVLGPGIQDDLSATKLVAANYPFLLNINESMTATR